MLSVVATTRNSSTTLNLILKLMVAGLLLLLHLLFGMHFHSNLDLVIPFLLLNLSLRLRSRGQVELSSSEFLTLDESHIVRSCPRATD